MDILKNIGKFLTGVLLFIVSLILIILMSPWGLIEMGILLFWKKRFWKGLGAFGEFILLFAILIDVAGNVILQVPMNRLLITTKGYKFGSRFDTISFVLGHSLVNETLTDKGFKLCKLIDIFDKDHCEKVYWNRLKRDKDYYNNL